MEEEKTGTRSSCPLALVTEDEEEGKKKARRKGKKSCAPVAGVIVQSLFSDVSFFFYFGAPPVHPSSLFFLIASCICGDKRRPPTGTGAGGVDAPLITWIQPRAFQMGALSCDEPASPWWSAVLPLL